MVRTTLWWCHPLADSYTAAIAHHLSEIARSHGPIETIDLYRNDAVPTGGDALVLIHPTWWSAEPAALLQGMERLPDSVSYRCVMTFSTHGSPRWVNLAEGRNARRNARRNLTAHVGARRHKWVALYAMDRIDDDARRRHVDAAGRALSRELRRLRH